MWVKSENGQDVIKDQVADVKLKDVARELVEFLVRHERIVEMKAKVTATSLERMETEKEQKQNAGARGELGAGGGRTSPESWNW